MKLKFIKKLFLLIAVMLAMCEVSHAQVMPDTNLVWISYHRSFGGIENIKISRDNSKVFVSTTDGNIIIVDYETGNFTDSIMGYGNLAGFSNDSHYFYTYTSQNIFKFDISNDQIITHLDSFPGGKGKFSKVSIMPDGRLAASLSQSVSTIRPDYLFYIIDGDSLKIQSKILQYNDSTFIPQYTYLPSSSMRNFCISQNDSIMAVFQDFLVSPIFPATYKDKINLWNLNTMTIIKNIPPFNGDSDFNGTLTDMSFLPNLNILILANDNHLYIYDYQ